MANARSGVEAGIVIFSLGMVVGYHVWLLLLRGRGYKPKKKYHDFFAAGKLARSVWARTTADRDSEAILAVQTARNAISAATWIAGVAAVLATAGLTIILDSSKTDRIAQLADADPMLKNVEGTPLASPIVILGLALGCLYCSFVCCAQAVRLYVHVGFYIRAVSSEYNPGTLTSTDAALLAVRAGWAFTLGLRLFYLFIPLVMWSIGVTALLVTSVIMTVLLYFMDRFEPGHATAIAMSHAATASSIPEVISSPASAPAAATRETKSEAGSTAGDDVEGARRRTQQMVAVQLAGMPDVV